MMAGGAGLLLPDGIAGGGVHVDHPKNIHHELASHAGVVTAGVPDQRQSAKQPDSIDADTASQPQVQLLLNGSHTHKGHAQPVLYSSLDSLNRVELLQHISTLSCRPQNMRLVCSVLWAIYAILEEQASLYLLPYADVLLQSHICLERHMA